MALLTVIGMAREYGPGAIELLGEQHAHEAVGKGERGERDELVGALLDARIEPVRASDHESGMTAVAHPAGEHHGKSLRRDGASTLVERDHRGVLRNGAEQSLAF